MSAAIFDTLRTISHALASQGVPPISPYWFGEAKRFYLHPTAKTLVECVGRGGDKSRTSTMMAIAEVLGGEFKVPPGERHYHTHIAENVTEAGKTLSILENYLRLINVPFTRTGDTIAIGVRPLGFKVLACRIGGVSGWRSTGWTVDETAKLSNDGVDPSAEVIASIRAMTVTHPNARGRMFSSPMGTSGFFFDEWNGGETETRLVGHAPTWVANPSVTEEQTHRLEPNERVWRREYAAEPQAGAGCIFEHDEVERAFQKRDDLGQRIGRASVVLDPSSGRRDSFTWALVGWVQTPGGAVLRVDPIDAVVEAEYINTPAREIVARIVHFGRKHGAYGYFGDQREGFFLREQFTQHSVPYLALDWTAASKPRAVETVKRWFREGTISIVEHSAMRRELLAFQEKITPAGTFTYGARGSEHDDHVALLLTAALVCERGFIQTPREVSRSAVKPATVAVHRLNMSVISDGAPHVTRYPNKSIF